MLDGEVAGRIPSPPRQLFPDGVQMTSELFADLEQLLRLTSKLTAGGGSTAC